MREKVLRMVDPDDPYTEQDFNKEFSKSNLDETFENFEITLNWLLANCPIRSSAFPYALAVSRFWIPNALATEKIDFNSSSEGIPNWLEIP